MTHLDDTNWFDPVEVANEAIAVAVRIGSPVSHLKLQKLIYIAHGVYLAALGTGLVRGGFQAWQFGPVSRDVYDAAKQFGAYDLGAPIGHGRSLPGEAEDARQVVEMIVVHYRDTTPMQLVALTHRPGTPWADVVSMAQGIPWAHRISDEAIRSYYKGQLG